MTKQKKAATFLVNTGGMIVFKHTQWLPELSKTLQLSAHTHTRSFIEMNNVDVIGQ